MVGKTGVSGRWSWLLMGVVAACGPSSPADEAGVVGSTASSSMHLLTAPRIDAISPTHGSPRGGYNLTISGTGFSGTSCVLNFGGVAVPVTPTSDHEIDMMVPAEPAGALPRSVIIYVTCGVYTTKSFAFDFIEDRTAILPPLTRRGSAGQRDLAFADFNGDGYEDMVVADPNQDRLTLYLGSGGGQFAESLDAALNASLKVDNGPYAVAVADLDQDKRMDIVVTQLGSSTVTILWNTKPTTAGPWLFAADSRSVATTSATGPKAVLIADLDADGMDDIIVAHPATRSLSFLAVTAARTVAPFLPITAPPGAPPNWAVDSIVAADLDGNKHPELITLSDGGKVLTIVPDGSRFAAPWQWQSFTTAYRGLATADLNGDKLPEIILGATTEAQVAVVEPDNRGVLNGLPPQRFATSGAVQSLDVADINGDTLTDVLIGLDGSADHSLDLLYGDSALMLKPWLAVELGSRGGLVRAADMDGDTHPDAVLVDFTLPILTDGSHLLTVRKNRAPSFTPLWLMDTGGPQPFLLTHLDADGDGKIDLAIADTITKKLGSFLGNGLGEFRPTGKTTTLSAAPGCLAAGNYSHDTGNCDDLLVCRSESTSHGIDLFPGTCDGGFPKRVRTYATATIPLAIAQDAEGAGLDGNDQPDFIVGGFGAPTLLTLLGQAPKAVDFTRQTYRAGTLVSSLLMASFNGGDSSVIAAAPQDNAIFLLTGDGLGNLGAARKLATVTEADTLAVGDFDGKLGRDVAALSSSQGTLTIFLNDGTGSFTLGPTVNFGTTSAPSALVVGDFNQDRTLDLAVRLDGLRRVQLLLGLGDGRFFTAGTQIVTESGGALDLVDVNKDGKPDLVLSGSTIVSGSAKGWLITLLTGAP